MNSITASARPTIRTCRESRIRASAGGMITSAGLASWKVMSTPRSRRFPVTVTHLPVTRCQICDRTLAYRPGNLSEVLTEHYRRAHPEALGISVG
jgi:hypothetical protein